MMQRLRWIASTDLEKIQTCLSTCWGRNIEWGLPNPVQRVHISVQWKISAQAGSCIDASGPEYILPLEPCPFLIPKPYNSTYKT